MSAHRWPIRPVPSEVTTEWRRAGLWDDTTLGVKIDRALRNHPEQRFHVHSLERPWEGTFGELRERALAVAGGLAQRGVRPGDAVAFQLPNWAEAAVAFYATSFLGAVVVPIVHFYGVKEVSYILRRTEVVAFVTAARFGRRDYLADLPAVVDAAPSVRVVAVVGSSGQGGEGGGAGDGAGGLALPAGAIPFEGLETGPTLPGPVDTDPDGPAVVAYTSGTTSDPKGVVHSHNTLGAEIVQLDDMNAGGGLPSLVGAPVGHFMGMLGALLVPAVNDMPVHLIDVWDPARVLSTMRTWGLSAGSGSTFFLTSLLDHPDLTPEHLSLMRYVGLGGSAVPVAVAERATAAGISVLRSYGATEHPSITGSKHDHDAWSRLRTDGRPMPGVEIRLLDDDGQPVPPGTPGEIWSRGPDCCVGYTDSEITARAFDAEGWYRTEDVGVLDDAGCLTITDRKKDIIIRGGENISAAEVEELLLQVVPGLAEAAVISVPDARFGEKVGAVLRMTPAAPAPDLDAVRALLLGAGLGRQKLPEYLDTVDDFPRTSTAKIIKAELRRRISARLVAAGG
ncbi:Acyl-CoA synthetase (AMP-forming)/AMP-acid ligase II [Parafrankia irregularis]|uniref:Acyl-CoA synthetase (AMP-forming)/AMP-acid ligase II n=1 Tax=Parafrankia irregularis TaxID=795642 RepID=A0A0S4QIY8_9ACTN|nr:MULTISPECIES: AMP-binding protein [Parafrankia]MBE3204020.1 AMP-binding protein [Parafrankia sp. CH37]CUU55103.1 Acyl-CoA synthetase (AMP-forming)/AMP-acid ligase II [Parafrankia irregularis]